jgi:hypothetical protein
MTTVDRATRGIQKAKTRSTDTEFSKPGPSARRTSSRSVKHSEPESQTEAAQKTRLNRTVFVAPAGSFSV